MGSEPVPFNYLPIIIFMIIGSCVRDWFVYRRVVSQAQPSLSGKAFAV